MAVKVCQRKDKPGWWVIAHYKGQRMKKAFGKDRKAAQDYAHAVRARMAYAEVHGEVAVLSEPGTSSSTTIKEYLGDWLDVYAKVHCKPSTYRGYKRSVEKHLIPAFGHLALKALKRDAVKRFVARKSEELVVRTDKGRVHSASPEAAHEPLKRSKRKARWTVMGYLVPLKAAYNQALEDGLVTMNPVARLGRLLRGRGDRKEHIEPLTAQEVGSLLHTAEERYPMLYPVILCAVRTGMRLGELIGLQWGDVDFHGGFLEVRRAIVLGEETVTKNHKIRRIDMSPKLQERLRQMKEIRDLEVMNQKQQPGPWVFRSPEGQRWDERNLRRGWYRLLEVAGLPPGTVSRSPTYPRVADGGARGSTEIRIGTARSFFDSGDDGHLFAPVSEWESRVGC
jgi:integrase